MLPRALRIKEGDRMQQSISQPPPILAIRIYLAPPDPDSSGGGDGKDKSGATPNSKASTVELAIEYIKQLQQEVAEANRRAEEAEKKLGLKETSKVDADS